MKPYIKIVIIVAAVIVVGLVIYFVWNALTAPATAPSTTGSAPYFPLAGLTGTSTAPATGGSTSTATVASPLGAFAKISDRPAAFFWTDPATQTVFYLDESGVVWQAEPGKDAQITPQGVAAINFIELSPDSKAILAAFGDPNAPSWGIYDSTDQVWRPLSSNILQATWGADSDTLIATEKNGGNTNLVTLDLTQTPAKARILVNDFRFLDTRLGFIPPATLLIAEKGGANYGGRVWEFNIKTSAMNLVMGPLNGLDVALANGGSTMMVYSSSGGFRILDAKTLQNVAPLPFTTLPEKCSQNSGMTVYCFVPTNSGFKSATLPDDYWERKIYTTDVLYGIDTASGGATLMPLPAGAVGKMDAEKPALAGGYLYFINRFDGYLYALQVGA